MDDIQSLTEYLKIIQEHFDPDAMIHKMDDGTHVILYWNDQLGILDVVEMDEAIEYFQSLSGG